MKQKIVYLKTDEITPYSNNPRANDSAVDMVAESIASFGFRNPIIVDKDRVINRGAHPPESRREARSRRGPRDRRGGLDGGSGAGVSPR